MIPEKMERDEATPSSLPPACSVLFPLTEEGESDQDEDWMTAVANAYTENGNDLEKTLPTRDVSHQRPTQTRRHDGRAFEESMASSYPTPTRNNAPRDDEPCDSPVPACEEPEREPQREGTTEEIGPTRAIFGAWAQIDALRRRVEEAEERARQEAQRAEIANHELREWKESRRREMGGAVAVDIHPLQCLTEEPSKERRLQRCGGKERPFYGGKRRGEVGVCATKEKESVDPFSAVSERELSTATAPATAARTESNASYRCTHHEQPSRSEDAPFSPGTSEEILQWRKRALEAEERLAKEKERAVASLAQDPQTTAATPSSSRTVESDLIRLKNAEIDVLRSQIHRLERRIQEECERNEDLLRSFHRNHHRGPDPTSPPLVVAECTAASEFPDSLTGTGRTTADVDEFRLLRDEIRHLQYQLSQTKRNHRNTNMTTASTTGSTLSSLDGNDADEYDEEEVGEEGNGPSSWGMCCNVWRSKKTKKGYGRV